MNNQPYIRLNQVITIITFLILLSYNKTNKVLIFYLLIIVSQILLPIIKKCLNYNMHIQRILLIIPLFIPAVSYSEATIFSEVKGHKSVYTLIIGIILILILLLTKKSEIINLFGIKINQPVTIKEELFEIICFFISILGEEFFFRVFIIQYFKMSTGVYCVLSSSFLFVLTHYNNRWSNKLFTIKSYIYQFLLSVVLGSIYYFSSSYFYVAILHILYNFQFLIISYRKLKSNKIEEITFNDYE